MVNRRGACWKQWGATRVGDLQKLSQQTVTRVLIYIVKNSNHRANLDSARESRTLQGRSNQHRVPIQLSWYAYPRTNAPDVPELGDSVRRAKSIADGPIGFMW